VAIIVATSLYALDPTTADLNPRPLLAAIIVQHYPAKKGRYSGTTDRFPRFCGPFVNMIPSKIIVSRRALLCGLSPAVYALALGSCADVTSTGARFDASDISVNPVLFVATTRKPVNDGKSRPWFGPERASTMTVVRAKLAPPSEARLSLASVGLDDWHIDAIEPVARPDELLGDATNGRDVLIYIHGFNQTFEMAALDAARLADGVRFRGQMMAFSWPSRAKLLDYAYDRDSAMWSRDSFEQMLTDLMSSPSSGRIHIVAHSIGSMPTMEALRQLYARDGETAADRIGSVVLASPDLDFDVFSSSIQRIGSLTPKITVISATNDRALALSGWLAGGITRVGAAQKVQLAGLGLRVIDASQEGWGVINHDLFLSNAHVRQVIRRAIGGDPGTPT
jgi:esterase/lipase superfamily enzyme